MSVFNKFCFWFIVGVVYANAATAGGDVSALVANWGEGIMYTCGTHDIGPKTCIGASRAGDASTSGTPNDNETEKWNDCVVEEYKGIRTRGGYTDERAVLMMVARDVTSHCAYFCPTQIEAKNENKGDAWTEYADAGNGKPTDCVWLCRDNSHWTEVPSASSSDFCDITEFSLDNYNATKRVSSGANIKGSKVALTGSKVALTGSKVALFKQDMGASCGLHKTQRHDMFLAIIGDVESKHGAIVRQMIVRANREGWGDMESWPDVYPASNSEEIVVCKQGYTPKGENCVDAVENCVQQTKSTNMCTNWNRNDYDSNVHDLVPTTGSTCYEFRCKGDKAFATGTKQCVTCINNSLHDGINPENGECVQCGTGYVFDRDNADGEYCSKMQLITKHDLQYGSGNTKSNPFNKQCWTMDQYDYENCVLGKSE